jgi:hypothetical protein
VISGALHFTMEASIVVGIVMAFVFGYSFTFVPLLRGGMALVPGAMAAGLLDPLFWGSLVLGLAIAFAVAFLVDRWLIARGRGHALAHGAHG